jgi:catabolite regulation protein CreA
MESMKIIINYIHQGENKLNEEDFFKNLLSVIFNEVLIQGLIENMKIVVNYINYINYINQGEIRSVQ